jgi:hypothetical protein
MVSSFLARSSIVISFHNGIIPIVMDKYPIALSNAQGSGCALGSSGAIATLAVKAHSLIRIIFHGAKTTEFV